MSHDAARHLRVLIVEDCAEDADLLLHAFQKGGYAVTSERVETVDEMRAALRRDSWHLVVSDYTLPSFSAPEALAVLREVNPELPFIIVSGTIGEETAVAALKAGACDFLVKSRLARLIPAVERELREVALKRDRALAHAALEEDLRQSQKMEGIGRLAGGIAHDFNNILTAIIGFSEIALERVAADDPIQHELHEIRTAADRAAALTRQLLAFSRKQTLRLSAVPLNEVIAGARPMLQRLIGEDIEVVLRLDPAAGCITADRVQLEQILINLASNARDAMRRGGLLTIGTVIVDATEHDAPPPAAPSQRWVKLSVTDTGEGMDADTRAHIFEPFFTTKPAGQGTGLGLATVYGVVQQLGGHMTVSSGVGLGTTFNLYFAQAAAADGTADPEQAPAPERAPATDRQVVLVVEDEQAVRRLTTRALEREGYEVIEADSTTEALAVAERYAGPLSLVISDVVMPVMDGPQMVARLRQLRPGLRALYMSGYAGETLSRRGGWEANARLLEKPFSASLLLRSVRQALELE